MDISISGIEYCMFKDYLTHILQAYLIFSRCRYPTYCTNDFLLIWSWMGRRLYYPQWLGFGYGRGIGYWGN